MLIVCFLLYRVKKIVFIKFQKNLCLYALLADKAKNIETVRFIRRIQIKNVFFKIKNLMFPYSIEKYTV